ncbi:hypothetical protein QWJ39_05165 [Arthrobacter sp. YD4]|uniref:hypothetical protein n=1 Tax=Arthrobacter sp. YD4 TaxID=3058043 RepID=UPI0025B5F279|nr:hypothetical protein [Arthrobacter sp. YD4]MDN3935699.1 hypothetical protein [Arthrobacter sp. YD4]
MGEKRQFKVGDLVDAKHWWNGVDREVHFTDGVIAEVLDPDNTVSSMSVRSRYAYYVVHACNQEQGDFFEEGGVKLRSADDAWRAGHFFLDDIVRADDGITSLEGVIEKFVAVGDQPYKVTDRTTKESAFFGDAHLTLKHRSRDSPRERFRFDDWVVADDGNVRLEDAVIGPDPMTGGVRVIEGSIVFGRRAGEQYVYAADGSGDVRLFWEEHLRPRTSPVPQELRDPERRVADYAWFKHAPSRARAEAAAESLRQWVETTSYEPSPLSIKPEPPKRPIVSGFRGVLMWIAAVPVATLTAESLAPGAGQVISQILVISSLGVVPWIARRIPA